MTGLANRFNWWWRNPGKELRIAFPDKSQEAIRKYVWPELWRRAFNYELASRHDGRRKYLLGKPFHQLTPEQMSELGRLWPRKPRPLEAMRIWGDGEPLSVEEDWLASHDRLGTGRLRWTVPQFFTMNLHECSDSAIVEAFRKYVVAERQRLGIADPEINKNKSKRAPSFHRIEAVDVWSLPNKKNLKEYDAGQKRKAQREAERLFQEWSNSLSAK